MKAIRFRLGGKTACFRKPDVNSYAYFTYNNIHKPALLGLLGAILGLGGHTQLSRKNHGLKPTALNYDKGFPEYYEKLKDLKIAIRPLAPMGLFSKRIQSFNNSVGYASKEQGGNLIVREQWLENPEWEIVILEDGSIDDALFKTLKERLLNAKATFIPYLGKNNHPARIRDVEACTLEVCETPKSIESLIISEKVTWDEFDCIGDHPYVFQEFVPSTLDAEDHTYCLQQFSFSNQLCEEIQHGDYYTHQKLTYAFY